MRIAAFVRVLYLVGPMLLSVVAVPTVSAQGARWGTPVLIETDDRGDAMYPAVAVDSSGNAVAAWEQSDGMQSDVWANRYVVGTGWGTPELVETVETEDAYDVRVAIDPGGNAVAVWEMSTGTHLDVWANRYVVGTGWGTAERIETNDRADAQYPQVAVDSSGAAVAVWGQQDAMNFTLDVWANRYVVGTGWGTAERIETFGGGDARDHRVAVDATGDAIAVWSQYIGSRAHIYANRYVVGAGWGTPELVEADDMEFAWYPDVAVDSNGNAVVVWEQMGILASDVWANRYVVGAGWGTPELVETNDVVWAEYPQVGVDPGGNAVTVWRASSGLHISANRYVVGTGWGTPERIDLDNLEDVGQPRVAVDSSGDAVAVWEQRDPTNLTYDIYANRYVPGTGWGAAGLVETNGTEHAAGPQVAVSPSGDAVVVWQQLDGSRFDIWANRCGTGVENPVAVTLVIAIAVLVPVLAFVSALVFLLVQRRKRGAGPKT